MSRPDIQAFIGANARGFHDAMNKVRADTRATASHAKRDFSELSAGLGRSMSLIKGAIAGVAANFVFQGARQFIGELADIEHSAKRAGLSVKAFQEMKYVSDQNRINVDAMIDAFKELSLRADEYVQTGGGSAADAFARLGMSPEEVKERLKDPSDLMIELIDRTRRLGDTAAGIRVFDELLGGQGGEQFVELIEQGREGITKTITEAETLGAVFSDDVIDKAAEADRLFHKWSQTISVNVKGAVVDAFNALQAFHASWQSFEDRTVSGLNAQKALLEKRRSQLPAEAGGVQDVILGWIGKDTKTELAAIDADLAKINDELERRKQIVSTTPGITDSPVTPYEPPAKTKPGKGGGRSSRDKEAEAALREQKAVEDLIRTLEAELALVGLSDVARDKEIALRKAGSSATGDQRARIEELIEARHREEQALQAVEEAQRRNAEAAEDAAYMTMDYLDSIIAGSFDAKEALSDMLKEMSRALLLGQGPLANLFGISSQSSGLGGLFGMIFGGARASGGDVTPGRLYRVNEKGEEYFSPGTHGRIIPAGGASGSGGSVYSPTYNIDARGAESGVEEKIRDMLEAYDRGNAERVANGYAEATRRGMI